MAPAAGRDEDEQHHEGEPLHSYACHMAYYETRAGSDSGLAIVPPGDALSVARVVYKPIGLLVSILGGILAGVVFKRLWKVAAHEKDPPKPTEERRGWAEVIAAATVQGAVFGGIKAAIDRAGATGFSKATGSWPGPKKR